MTVPAERRTESFAQIRDDVAEIIGTIVYATMTTVDRRGRPRSRVLIVVWELDGDRPVGWLATFKTPVKAAHLAHNPHVTTSYWSPRQNAVYLDSVAAWVDDADVKGRVWRMYQEGSPPGVGYQPAAYWRGPDDPAFHVLRLDPWRAQVLRARDLARGDLSGTVWRADAVDAVEAAEGTRHQALEDRNPQDNDQTRRVP
jgi:general stress protein 26